MIKGKIVIISGPSGSGKTTLHKKLLASKRLKELLVKSISVTTRPRRPGEKHGRDYLFLSRNEFLARKKAGRFLEWQKVFDNYYGTPRQAVERLLKAGKNVLLCIDVKGARVVARQFPQAVKVFIQAPSFSVLKKRLKARGTETRSDMRLRFETARKEMQEATRYNYTVVNDDLSQAARKLDTIVYSALKEKKASNSRRNS